MRVLAITLFMAALAGCGSSSAPNDGSTNNNCGTGTLCDSGIAQDAGTSADAGHHDAAVAHDSGTSHVDLGTNDDAGTPDDMGTIGTTDSGTSPCGSCPDGYTCGSANSIPVCRSANGIPLFKHVFIIMMENTTLSSLQASGVTPYIDSLTSDYAYATDYHGTDHPSLPNYIGLTSGMDTSSIGCDCHPTGGSCGTLNCGTLRSNCGCPQDVENVADQIESAGLTWHDYAEDMGDACNTTDSGNYVARHVPFLYYPDVLNDTTRCTTNVIDYSNLSTDLASLSTTPNFSLIAPNLVDDMHNPFIRTSTNYMNGDTWLSNNVPMITGSAAFADGGILFIVWDEDDYSGGLTGSDDPVPFFVISNLAKNGGYPSTVTANHYSLLATVEDGLNLANYLGQAATASPMSDLFPDN